MKTVQENERTIPVAEEADVVVCGGGPAGVAAALASARSGARTCLVEMQGCLGGMWTSGCLPWIIDHGNKQGVLREILERLDAMGARTRLEGSLSNAFDIESMKLLLDSLCDEAGATALRHHFVTDAITQDARLTHAIVESKSGRQAIGGRVFIDCTGDGDLAARAGCAFDTGREGTGETQPMSLLALVAGIAPSEMKPFFRYAVGMGGKEAKLRLKDEMERAGRSPSYGHPTLIWIRDDLFFLMANHEYGRSGTNARDLSDATARARKELHALVDGLRRLGGIWRDIRLVATGAHIGVRETRRIRGRYVVTAEDMAEGARHPDAACRATFGIDVHSTDGNRSKSVEPAPIRTQPYDIPVRSLIARDLDNLMMAGRCVSGDFLAHSSYRVTGNAAAMGEAAGKVAARAAISGRLPHEVSPPRDANGL